MATAGFGCHSVQQSLNPDGFGAFAGKARRPAADTLPRHQPNNDRRVLNDIVNSAKVGSILDDFDLVLGL